MPRNSLKRYLVGFPVIGKLLLIGSDVIHLPEHHREQEARLDQLANNFSPLPKQMLEASTKLEKAIDKVLSLQKQQDEIQKRMAILEKSFSVVQNGSQESKKNSNKELFANDHLLDIFYTDFEDKFRGSEEVVAKNLEVYLPYFKKAEVDYKKHPVLDIGSGRGELLRLLKSHDIPALGLDINIDMVERSNKGGLPTKQGDALTFLEETANQTYGTITGFHVAEHIPFISLFKIFKEAHRCLANDGFVIFETPNPENLVVGSTTFYYDPSHLHPLPPMLLSYTLETCGFRKVKILRLHPDEDQHSGSIPKEVARYLFGPRDYAVIGYK